MHPTVTRDSGWIGDAGTVSRRRLSRTAALLALGLCVLAFFHQRNLTRDLEWPAFNTQYREVATAQTLLDAGPSVDSTYRGERPWYNPLASWVLAGLHELGGWPLRTLSPRLGTYVNVLCPIAFFVVLARLIDPWTALVALSAFLFLTGNGFPLGMAAGYSPWFTPQNLAQPFFYAALYAAYSAFSRPWRGSTFVVVGALLGFAFLAHTAAALVLGVVIFVLAAFQIRSGATWTRAARGIFLVFATAFVVSLPFARSVLFHYGLRVINPWPTLSPTTTLDLNEQPTLVWNLLTRSPLSVAVLGIGVYFLTVERRGWAKRVLTAWFLAVVAFFFLHDMRLILGKAGVVLPSIVPAYHFLFHLMVLVSVGYGVAIGRLCVRAVRRLGPGPRTRRAAARLAVAAALLTAAGSWPWYVSRPEFIQTRKEADELARAIPGQAYDWIRANTRTSDVFLCTDEYSLFVVNPAGRKVIATNRYFSSPYVDWRSRDADRDKMFRALESGDVSRLRELAAPYRVRYLVVATTPDPAFLAFAGTTVDRAPHLSPKSVASRLGFAPVFAGDRASIFALDP